MDRANNLRLSILLCAMLSLITLAAYWPVLHNDFVHFDDTDYVTENIHVLTGLTWENIAWAFSNGYASNWHPLTWLSHMLDIQLFGLNPIGHHLTSLLFHLANTLLLFAVLGRMTGAIRRSAFVAALFAVHPLHVESVAWVAERKDVLSMFFLMLTLWAYARYVEVQSPKSKVQRRESKVQAQEPASGITHHASRITFHVSCYYLLSLLFFACGVMSKPMLVTVPFVLLLLDYWPLGRLEVQSPKSKVQSPSAEGKIRNAESRITHYAAFFTFHLSRSTLLALLLEKLPFLALAAASSAITFLVQQGGHATSIGLPLGPRLANAVASYLKYLGKTVWPVDLAVFYPHPDLRYPISNQWPLWQIVSVALLLAAVSGLAIVRRKREPWLATGWFWYLGTLVPVIGIVQVGGQAIADRYTYIPLIGIFICFVWGAAEFFPYCWRQHQVAPSSSPGPQPAVPTWSQASYPAWLRVALGTAGGLVLVACVVLTRAQAAYWRNNSILFEHALAVTSDNPIAEYNVGSDLARAGQYQQALPHFQAAAEADPTYADATKHLRLSKPRCGSALGTLRRTALLGQSIGSRAIRTRP
jgi:hypothetical protein